MSLVDRSLIAAVLLALASAAHADRQVIPPGTGLHVEADAVDTAPAPDDAANPDNNSASVEIDAVDLNDL